MLACSPRQIQNLLLDLRLQPAPGRDKLLKCRIVPTKFRQPFRIRRKVNLANMMCQMRRRVQFPPPPLFLYRRLQATARTKTRVNSLIAMGFCCKTKWSFSASRRQCAAARDRRAATESATGPRVIDPALAAVVAAWPDLPATVQAGILAMVGDRAVLKNSI